ncbi:MAG: hypothetical protein JRJ56_09205 [Deltaproteobacteria bacterium]|nr:hypothetical protein [Deltaproteobacteria bacterium]
MEAAITVLSLNRGIVHPTINLENQDELCDLNYVPNQAMNVSLDAAISNSFGFGGTNACLAFSRYQD